MRSRALAAGLLLAALLAAPAAAQTGFTGVVTATAGDVVQIDGVRYVITAETVLESPGGDRVAPHELVPGTRVEVEVGEDGRLLLLRADLVR
jgi:predicted S18 family serine protease